MRRRINPRLKPTPPSPELKPTVSRHHPDAVPPQMSNELGNRGWEGLNFTPCPEGDGVIVPDVE